MVQVVLPQEPERSRIRLKRLFRFVQRGMKFAQKTVKEGESPPDIRRKLPILSGKRQIAEICIDDSRKLRDLFLLLGTVQLGNDRVPIVFVIPPDDFFRQHCVFVSVHIRKNSFRQYSNTRYCGLIGQVQFIIPRPKQIIKRKMPEISGNQGKTPSFPPTSCPEPAGQGVTASCFGVAKRLNYVRVELDFSRNRC